jgi:hypothetical protein
MSIGLGVVNLGEFGWNQLLTIFGLIVTMIIAGLGFRSFGRWKREKIEERRIDVALEALSVAYEAVDVFADIRNPGAFEYEYADMPRAEGESDEEWRRKTTFYVPLKRMDNQKEFFIKVLKLRPRLMAVFGPEVEKIFAELNQARAYVQVAAQMLMRPDFALNMTEENVKLRTRLEADMWSGMAAVHSEEELPGGDRVQRNVNAFRDGIVKLCRPIVDREFKVKA